MSILDPLSSLFKGKNTPSGAPSAGIANGQAAGFVGVWVAWNSEQKGTEVFRVTVKCASPNRKPPEPVSFTFGPAYDASFCQNLEFNYDLKQFLVGSDRALQGEVAFEFLLSGQNPLVISYSLEEVIKNLRHRGKEAPSYAPVSRKSIEADNAQVRALKPQDLKEYSEKIKRELEEKRRLEEEAAKKRAEEKAAAEAKAQEAAKAKAAADKAAKSGGGAAAVDKTKPSLPPHRVLMVYGSSTGNTAEVANMIKAELGESVNFVKNVSDLSPLDFTVPEVLILGVPTWHIGEMQDDWALILPEVGKQNFAGKKVAIFGLGDGKGYAETYVDAMAELLAIFEKSGAKLAGMWPTEGYEFKASKAIRGGKFLGLVIDVENQHHLSEGRVKAWANQIKTELGI